MKTNLKAIANAMKVKKSYIPIISEVILTNDQAILTNLSTFVKVKYYAPELKLTDPNYFRQINLDIVDNFQPTLKNTNEVDETEFPLNLALKESNFVNVWFNENDIKNLIEATNFVTKDDLRPAMCGVYVGSDIVATNAHKLYYKPFSSPIKDVSFILPTEFIKILKILKVNNANIQVSNSYVKLITDDFEVYARLIDANYPNYKSVIPSDNPFYFEVNKTVFEKAVKNLLPFTNKVTKKGIMELNGSFKLTAEDIDRNIETAETIDTFTLKKDNDINIGFNVSFMMDCIKDIPKNENVKLTFSQPNRAMIINESRLLMPVMTN